MRCEKNRAFSVADVGTRIWNLRGWSSPLRSDEKLKRDRFFVIDFWRPIFSPIFYERRPVLIVSKATF